MNLKIMIRVILRESLILPVLRLKKTHPNAYITAKGYEILLRNATDELFDLMIGKKK